jgi:endonuclease YncB( thermonuclease family)
MWHDFAPPTLKPSNAFASSQASPSARFSAGYVHVIDGDTLRADGERIRLVGIDAPELSQTCFDAQKREWSCGRAARARLIALISHEQVACIPQGRDRYGRTLATCSAGHVADLGEALVRDGYAVDYRRFTDQYLTVEQEARDAGRGIWRGTFERPELWRHRRSG